MFTISPTWMFQIPHLKMSRTTLIFSSRGMPFVLLPIMINAPKPLHPHGATCDQALLISDLDYGSPVTLIMM